LSTTLLHGTCNGEMQSSNDPKMATTHSIQLSVCSLLYHLEIQERMYSTPTKWTVITLRTYLANQLCSLKVSGKVDLNDTSFVKSQEQFYMGSHSDGLNA